MKKHCIWLMNVHKYLINLSRRYPPQTWALKNRICTFNVCPSIRTSPYATSNAVSWRNPPITSNFALNWTPTTQKRTIDRFRSGKAKARQRRRMRVQGNASLDFHKKRRVLGSWSKIVVEGCWGRLRRMWTRGGLNTWRCLGVEGCSKGGVK